MRREFRLYYKRCYRQRHAALAANDERPLRAALALALRLEHQQAMRVEALLAHHAPIEAVDEALLAHADARGARQLIERALGGQR